MDMKKQRRDIASGIPIEQLGNPFSTGGGGNNFENHIQAAFVTLMLAGGFVPCLPSCWPIIKVQFQRRPDYATDDFIVITANPSNAQEEAKLLVQIKHSISITNTDQEFCKVIKGAWRDFKNPEFRMNSDAIALITGPISDRDTKSVNVLLEKARAMENERAFIRDLELGNWSSQGCRDKFGIFKTQLKIANNGQDVTDLELWLFLKHFHRLGFDLDIKSGMILALIRSLIGTDAQSVWARILEEIRFYNQNAGTITKETLPADIRSSFKRLSLERIPDEIALKVAPPAIISLQHPEYSNAMAMAVMLGEWDEKNNADREIAAQLAGEEYNSWVSKIREILQLPESPLSFKDGKWSIISSQKRLELWQSIGARLFDDHLERFKQCVITVLKEKDPQFELPPNERYAASIHNKVLKHSQNLRQGLAETLALLGSYPGYLTNCSPHKVEEITTLALRDVLSNSDWILWGSLNDLLPLMAEASPSELLNQIESSLNQKPCPFDELYAQEEKDAFWGRNYMTGLLWALETLAWDEQFLARTTGVFGKLAERDPGGKWSNRPVNSLTTIFLPWLPQTIATVEKRKGAILVLKNESPDIAWKLLLSLLPEKHQTSMGTHKPIWRRTIPDNWEKKVTHKEYWDQVSNYTGMLVEMAANEFERLCALAEHIGNLIEPYFSQYLELLSANEVIGRPEEEREKLWQALTKLARMHKRFLNAKWALAPELVGKVEQVASLLAPKNPMLLYNYLFSNQNHDLYDENGNWEEQTGKIEEQRQKAIKEIMSTKDISGIINFAQEVEYPENVGYSLAYVAEEGVESIILPSLINSETEKLTKLAYGFVQGSYRIKREAWVDGQNVKGWSGAQISKYLAWLPFSVKTWEKAKLWLGDNESEYWRIASVNPFHISDEELYTAIDKLLQYNRPIAAIDCLYRLLHDKHVLDKTRSISALLAAINSNEPHGQMDSYYITEIIKALQTDPDTNQNDLFKVEWAYLSILNEHNHASPKLLEHKLATEPEFFCQVIQRLFHSRKESGPRIEASEEQKAIALNVYRLLDNWKTPPGMQADGSFSETQFSQWLEAVKKACIESGHIENAMTYIGQALTHCPPDPDGFWILHAVARALNQEDAQDMRNGFDLGISNSRGAHFIDPTGKPEKELAEKYRERAEETENKGYQRLANTLRNLAKSYEREAEWNIAEHLDRRSE